MKKIELTLITDEMAQPLKVFCKSNNIQFKVTKPRKVISGPIEIFILSPGEYYILGRYVDEKELLGKYLPELSNATQGLFFHISKNIELGSLKKITAWVHEIQIKTKILIHFENGIDVKILDSEEYKKLVSKTSISIQSFRKKWGDDPFLWKEVRERVE